MLVYKKPEFEDDSYYFVLEKNDVLVEPLEIEYLNRKREAFDCNRIDKEFMFSFLDRPSFTGVELQYDLVGTIYTKSAEEKNNMHIDRIIKSVKDNKDKSRRCVITIADTLKDYLDDSINTSCLNIIHYHKDVVKLFFRASDMTNELLYDIYLIKEFFIDPVYKNDVDIHIISSTAQNILEPKELIIN